MSQAHVYIASCTHSMFTYQCSLIQAAVTCAVCNLVVPPLAMILTGSMGTEPREVPLSVSDTACHLQVADSKV